MDKQSDRYLAELISYHGFRTTVTHLMASGTPEPDALKRVRRIHDELTYDNKRITEFSAEASDA